MVARPIHTVIGHYVRGSSLLLVGQLLSKGVDCAVLILIVRHLSKSDYGAFAYALSIVQLGQSLATFGLNQAINRFVPIYHEQHKYNQLFGIIIMVVSTTLLLGLTIILLVHGCQGLLAQLVGTDQQTLTLLLILIILSPVQALDTLLMSMFAIFANPRAIFFRKYVAAPVLQLIVVLLLIVSQSDVSFLASGYLAVGGLGVAMSTVMLFPMLRDQGLYQHFNLWTIKIPVREVFAFAIPLFTTDLMYLLMDTLDAVLLGYFRGNTDVAALRAVQPVARLNHIVMANFVLLFEPLAARLFARNDQEGIDNLYWRTAVWIAVISFPIFLLTFSLARPLTVLLYGTRYEQSAMILALLSFGYYFNAALGFNGTTLAVFGKVRYMVVINSLATVVNLSANLLLIPRYGALGAAIGTCGTLVVHNILKQAGLRLGIGISLFRRHYFKVYLIIALSALGLLLVQLTTSSFFYLSLVLAVITSLLVLKLSCSSLDIGQTFPELQRFPLVQRLLGE